MAITRTKKTEQLQALIEKFKKAQGVAFVKFDQATVLEVEAARRELRAKGMSYTVIKKTLLALAAKEAGLAEFSSDLLPGCVAAIVSPNDSVAPAQEIKRLKQQSFDKVKKFSKFDFAGALFEGQFLNPAAAAVFANTATREESLSKIVGMLRSGPQKMHGVLLSGLRTFHNVMKNADKFVS